MSNFVALENVRLIFKNFSGEASRYNAAGARNFCVLLEDEELVQKLIDEGYNVRQLKVRDEDETPRYRLKVNVSYKYVAPRVWQIINGRKVELDEESVAALDHQAISSADLVFKPSAYDGGVSAYLTSLYATIEDEDPFYDRYSTEWGGESDVDLPM